MSPREEEILVLYGSQKGTGEKQAEEIVQQIPEKLRPDELRRLTGSPEDDPVSDIKVTGRTMDLDDFLKEGCPFTSSRVIIIVVSSFGMGGAPMNARNFRKFCDKYLWDRKQQKEKDKEKDADAEPATNHEQNDQPLKGLYFALLGLGDSNYKTYMRNPIIVQETLEMAGAKMLGERGIADADPGEEEQLTAMRTWADSIWHEIAIILVCEPPFTQEQIQQMSKFAEG